MFSFERFKELANSINSSPNAIASELGYSSGSVTAWNRGTAPSSEVVYKLAKRFSITADYLLGLTDNPRREAAPASVLDTKLARLSDDDILAIEKQVDFMLSQYPADKAIEQTTQVS